MEETVRITRKLVGSDLDFYEYFSAHVLSTVAKTYGSLGYLFGQTNRFQDAEVAYTKALELERPLAVAHAEEYRPSLAGLLNTLAKVHHELRNFAKAQDENDEATGIFKGLDNANHLRWGDALANSLLTGAYLLTVVQQDFDFSKYCSKLREAMNAANDAMLKQEATAHLSTDCK